jgi:glycerate-2-kinase
MVRSNEVTVTVSGGGSSLVVDDGLQLGQQEEIGGAAPFQRGGDLSL